MSINQLTTGGNKNWLNVRVDDMIIDGVLKVNDTSAIIGNTLQCTAPGKAQFRPQFVLPEITMDYYQLTNGNAAGVNGAFNYTIIPDFVEVNFEQTAVDELKCLNAGRYLVTKKICLQTLSTATCAVLDDLNGGVIPQSLIKVPYQTTSVAGCGVTSSYIIEMLVDDIFSTTFAINPSGATLTLSTAANIQLLKIA